MDKQALIKFIEDKIVEDTAHFEEDKAQCTHTSESFYLESILEGKILAYTYILDSIETNSFIN